MSDDYRDELTGWRLYYLHRGRLCSPMMRELQPVARVEAAICLHDDHEVPDPDCWCGFRVADNIDALFPAAEAMAIPVRLPPVLARVREEHPERSDNAWGIPEDVLAAWDWPAPALVRVRGHGGVRVADDVFNDEVLIASVIEADGTRNLIREGQGMHRAARVQILGPIITGQSERPYQFHPSLAERDVAMRYAVQYHEDAAEWLDVLERVAGGWLPPAPNRAPRRSSQRRKPKRRRNR